jgi:hypothetical protein
MSNLPAGWRLESEFDPGVAIVDGHYRYVVYRWGIWTTKRWFRSDLVREGWGHAGYSSRYRNKAVEWIQDTIKAEAAATKN